MTENNRRLGILISGRGSNLQSIIDAVAEDRLVAVIAVVVSNEPGAAGLQRARLAGIETLVIDHRTFPSRSAYDTALVEALRGYNVGLVCLAGFMRLLGKGFVDAFSGRILNIHPSLLPAFPGLHGQQQALEYGVRVTGATVHIVTPDLDAGPIVMQASVAIGEDDTVQSLSERILVEEHRIYPEAIARLLSGRWRIEGRRFVKI
ncbi:MAG: phosphoribosylglycinamide formyltransferase [Acidobacteria bacterium]|nr:phosphoribosylglycinamide formyltransferase [Acidobacteriota bacterium]